MRGRVQCMASRVVPPPATGHFTLKRVPPGTWYRVHPNRYAPGAFNDSGLGNARFSPLMQPGTGEVIPTIYAADTIRGAIMEVVLHDVPRASAGYIRPLARDRKSDNHLSVIQLPELRLVNLTATGLRSVGLTAADMFEGDKPDYPRTRAWASWIWENLPRAHGLLWMSRQDNESRAIMLFGDRLNASEIVPGHSEHIARHESVIVELLGEMGASASTWT